MSNLLQLQPIYSSLIKGVPQVSKSASATMKGAAQFIKTSTPKSDLCTMTKNKRCTKNHHSRKIFTITLVLVTAVLITACSGTTTKSTKQYPLSLAEKLSEEPSEKLSSTEIQQEIIRAKQLDQSAKNTRLIQLSKQLYKLGHIQSGISLIQSIDNHELSDEQYISYTIVSVKLLLADQSIFEANAQLNEDRLRWLWPQLTVEQQIQLHGQKASLSGQLGNTQDSIKEYILRSSLLTHRIDITENHESLWQELSKLSLSVLEETLRQNTIDEITQGWYELAKINKSLESNIKSKYQEAIKWASLNPRHPASQELPLDLQLLKSIIKERPQKIALLLPMQGKLAPAAKAIRDGFFSAYYNHGHNKKPQVKLYDTTQTPISTLYDSAVKDGADLVIGPLEKDKVAELQQRNHLPVRTLALNYNTIEPVPNADNTPETTINKSLYQFGLALEDEAIQAADRAWLEGHRYAMIIASEANWSKRAANTFIKYWRSLGGIVVVNSPFTKGSNYSDTIKTALAIDQSKARATKLKRLFGKSFEFEPRRRQDIDMIFLVARPEEGQQIKPTLAFHYAGRVPVYATSQIYSSTQSINKNRDLNGIRFTTLPWTLNPDNPEKQLIIEHLTMSPRYERLYAMGVDSFLLHDRLLQLRESPNISIYGATGKLYLNSYQRIVREQPWAEIVKGAAQPLPYLTQDSSHF